MANTNLVHKNGRRHFILPKCYNATQTGHSDAHSSYQCQLEMSPI